MALPPGDMIRELLLSSNTEGRRSTVLTDLRWIFAVLLGATLFSAWQDLPALLTAALGSAAGLSFLIILGSYLYFARRNPDLLRSEQYSLRKLEIERGFLGDSTTGLLQRDEPLVALPGSIEVQEGED